MNDGRQFELEVQRLLQQMGFDADITGYSQDGGIDLIAVNHTPVSAGRYVIQCKDWLAPVGEPALRDLFGTVHSEGANKGILITTSSFTAAAQRFAQGKPLELIDGATYRSLCEQHGISPMLASPLPTTDVVFQTDATTVRIMSVKCTDPKERAEFRHYLFSVGTLSIGSKLAYVSPGTGSFEFSHYRVRQVSCETSLTARLELSFVVEHVEPVTYDINFEGRSEVISPLYKAASAQMARGVAQTRSSTGCLVMLAFPIGVAAIIRLIWNV